jgi:hypothetical protein
VKDAVAAKVAIGQRLRVIFESVGRRFRAAVVHGERLILFHQDKLHPGSVALDRSGLYVSRHPQALRVSGVAHGLQLFDGDVIAFAVLDAGIRQVTQQHHDERGRSAELQKGIGLARHTTIRSSKNCARHAREIQQVEWRVTRFAVLAKSAGASLNGLRRMVFSPGKCE